MSVFKMVTYPITTHFREIDSFHPTPHTGIDFACPVGTQAQSISDGVVSRIANDPLLGENIRVNAGNGTEWVYGHLSSVNATYGQRVKQGDVLGLTGGVPGTPGAGHSTGAHLHLTLLQNGTPVDPNIVLSVGNDGLLSKLGHLFTTPGAELAGLPPLSGQSTAGIVLNWIGSGLTTFIHVMPELCGVLAMVFMLGGMVGSKKLMNYAGTSVLLAFVGVILNAAIG